jgi:hypothetical protein
MSPTCIGVNVTCYLLRLQSKEPFFHIAPEKKRGVWYWLLWLRRKRCFPKILSLLSYKEDSRPSLTIFSSDERHASFGSFPRSRLALSHLSFLTQFFVVVLVLHFDTVHIVSTHQATTRIQQSFIRNDIGSGCTY